MFSPQYTGYDAAIGSHGGAGGRLAADGYRPTRGRGPSLTLGTAMAISGAAASPNMGYHSSPPLAFLMTVFNVRLGWWFGNPRHPRCWNRPGPRWGLFYLLFELLGSTNDRRGFVYLSDGGHFENLGVYELVKRRCRFILACDASQDGKLQFGDLGNAVEKCRTDLGIDIRIDAEALRGPAGGGRQRQHWALGRICYGTADPGAPDGTFLYLKASLTCDEPQDVKSYQRQHPGFPHQSTADQWFEEDQFESYRALGHHIADRLLERLPVPERVLEAGLDELRAALGPPEEGDLWH